ncbi:MAG: peptide chain release factor N(5)-glutamine methyltransferase [Thermodesulfobacteriota bacterium]
MIKNKNKENSLREALKKTEASLSSAGITEAAIEAEWILAEVLQIKRYEIFLQPGRVMTEDELKNLNKIIKRRERREPLAYITGRADFRGFTIKVSEATLIPRPETELLVDEALGALEKGGGPKLVLEPCTGSGCISLALAAEFHEAIKIIACDISKDALLIARENAACNNVEDKISFLRGDLLMAIKPDGAFDLIVANPPYIRETDMTGLQAEVRLFEPPLALDGGADGLDYIKRLIGDSAAVLRPGGSLLLEIGLGQALETIKFTDAAGFFEDIHMIRDLSGIERILSARKKS